MGFAPHRRLKRLIASALGPRRLGALDYYRFPKLKKGIGGPFNGQVGRIGLFRDIVRHCQPDGVIETGAFRGTTTEFIARETGLPTFTVEVKPRYAGYVEARLRRMKNATVFACDSRQALEALVGRLARPFCYLDAHWYDDLPLFDEIQMIHDTWPDAVIMIDDFRVEGDPGYFYDDYGGENRLCIECLAKRTPDDLVSFFPTLPASEETGAKRGCIVLARADSLQIQRLSGLPSLKRYGRP